MPCATNPSSRLRRTLHVRHIRHETRCAGGTAPGACDEHESVFVRSEKVKPSVLGPAHGHTIAHAIERGSDEILHIEHGSLYPALHRLEDRGWIASFWGTSENNRKAKYYRLTPEGKKQLAAQASRWEELVRAIGRILNPAHGGQS